MIILKSTVTQRIRTRMSRTQRIRTRMSRTQRIRTRMSRTQRIRTRMSRTQRIRTRMSRTQRIRTRMSRTRVLLLDMIIFLGLFLSLLLYHFILNNHYNIITLCYYLCYYYLFVLNIHIISITQLPISLSLSLFPSLGIVACRVWIGVACVTCLKCTMLLKLGTYCSYLELV